MESVRRACASGRDAPWALCRVESLQVETVLVSSSGSEGLRREAAIRPDECLMGPLSRRRRAHIASAVTVLHRHHLRARKG